MGQKIRQPDHLQPTTQGEVTSAFGYVRRQKWTAPDAEAAATILNDQATSASVITTVLAAGMLAQPDFPRKISITPGGTTADVPAGDVTLTGTNIRNEVITDTITFAANATAKGATTKAFKTLTSIVFPIQDGADATYDVGIEDALGLDRCMEGNEVLLATIDGVYETTRPTVTFDNNEVEKNTINPNTALDANVDLVAVFVSTERTSKRHTTA